MRPRDQRVVVGEAAYFHCAAKGRDHQGKPPLLSWLRDGITIDLRSVLSIKKLSFVITHHQQYLLLEH